MPSTSVIIIGGGPAGLAISRCLVASGVDHVVLERGRVAERWRAASWDSLHLLTPNWLSRLPGWQYAGPEPDGFMSKDDVIAHLDGYARSFDVPILPGTEVVALERTGETYRAVTNRGPWHAPAVVIATGQCGTPHVPSIAERLPAGIRQFTPAHYRNPSSLPEGGVLIVGASASGVQLAEEIQRSGRPVTLSVGRHTRVPRRYRGRDIMWWLDRLGILDERTDGHPDPDKARNQQSLQLIGRTDGPRIDLAGLHRIGVRIVGRTVGAQGGTVEFANDLAATTADADRRLLRLRTRIDDAIDSLGIRAAALDPMAPMKLGPSDRRIDLAAAGIESVIWATGYAPRYPWLRVPVLDGDGAIRHGGGITPAPGLFVLGLPWLRRRSSSFIDGIGADAQELAPHIVRFVSQRQRVAA